jgi:hypothetical protein
MTSPTPPVDPTRWYRLPVMWLVVLLPLLAFVGGGLMVVLTSLKPDPEVYSERLEAPAPVQAPGG